MKRETFNFKRSITVGDPVNFSGTKSTVGIFREKEHLINRVEGDEEKRISAHDLFSMFTADIMKNETVFIR